MWHSFLLHHRLFCSLNSFWRSCLSIRCPYERLGIDLKVSSFCFVTWQSCYLFCLFILSFLSQFCSSLHVISSTLSAAVFEPITKGIEFECFFILAECFIMWVSCLASGARSIEPFGTLSQLHMSFCSWSLKNK